MIDSEPDILISKFNKNNKRNRLTEEESGLYSKVLLETFSN